jgi:hypothetical protein
MYTELHNAILITDQSDLKNASDAEKAFDLSRAWITSFLISESNNQSIMLLEGAFGAAVETVSLTFLRLLRPAVFSLRAHYESALAWLYYRDHPTEWQAVQNRWENVRLPGTNKDFLKKYAQHYEARWKVLSNNHTRLDKDDPYSLLSAIVHGSTAATIPSAKVPADLVFDGVTAAQIIPVIRDTCQFISDIYVASSSTNWESIPERIRADLVGRLADDARTILNFV